MSARLNHVTLTAIASTCIEVTHLTVIIQRGFRWDNPQFFGRGILLPALQGRLVSG
jgi:hypothetical protein